MPKLSDTMTVGTLVNWLKKEGDPVSPGDMLAEVETDKATMEIENFEEGVLLKQYVKAGDQVPIGAPIAAIGEKGESLPDASAQPAAKAQPKEEKTASVPAIEPKTESNSSSQDSRIKASPLARKMAEDKGLDLKSISGTGPNGRIVKADILNAATSPKAPVAVQVSCESKSLPVSNMRATIAQRLVESKTQIPHFYLDIEVDAAPMLELRKQLNDSLGELPAESGGIKFTVNDFILKAAAVALKRVPRVNSSWMGSTIEQHGAVHLSFGVAIEDGLLTPVIRNTDQLSLRNLSLAAKELINKARNKKLKPEEMSGSTFTVTNLGMFGINSFFGIINPPNSAILSVGATVSKPVINAKGEIVPGQRMNIGFSGDHRVIDGAAGAEFLATMRDLLEKPTLMLV